MKEFAEITFKMLGTTTNPNGRAKDFLNFLKTYQFVCDVKKNMQKDIFYLKNLFNEHKDLQSISFLVCSCPHEGDYYLIDCVSFPQCIDISAHNFSHHILNYWEQQESVVLIERDNFLYHFENLITPEQENIFNMVELFEKRQIEGSIHHCLDFNGQNVLYKI